MKRFGWLLIILLAATPGWCARKITVGQLEDMLKTLHQQDKSDQEVADALKQVELTEELTRSTMNSLVSLVPGPHSTEQVYVLEARSAMLAPPVSDLPTTPAPDTAAQKAILDKAAGYVSKTYAQLPALTTTKTTARFQDNVEAAAPSSGMHGSARDVSTGSSFVDAYQFVHYINAAEAHVASDHGAEQASAEKDTTPWGANSMNAIQEPDPSLGTVFQEAQDSGTIKWLRWELINGKPAAVFSFEVPKKKAHYPVDVCCFPNVDQAGKVTFTSASGFGAGQPGGTPGQAGGAKGNLQTNTSWHPYKANVSYHGELFIDPDSGTVVRMITQADLKASDVVHRDDERIEYGPANVGDKSLTVPVRTITSLEVVPNGDSGSAGRYSVRNTYLIAEYKEYQASAGK